MKKRKGKNIGAFNYRIKELALYCLYEIINFLFDITNLILSINIKYSSISNIKGYLEKVRKKTICQI